MKKSNIIVEIVFAVAFIVTYILDQLELPDVTGMREIGMIIVMLFGVYHMVLRSKKEKDQ